MLGLLILPQCRSWNVKTSQDVQREAYEYIGLVMVTEFASCYSIELPYQWAFTRKDLLRSPVLPQQKSDGRRHVPFCRHAIDIGLLSDRVQHVSGRCGG
jgi:hypothetical protein